MSIKKDIRYPNVTRCFIFIFTPLFYHKIRLIYRIEMACSQEYNRLLRRRAVSKAIIKRNENHHVLMRDKSLSMKEWGYYSSYQQQILNHIEWIETDDHRLEKILFSFLDSGLVHSSNQKEVFQTALKTYYICRKNTAYQMSDDELLELIVFEYHSLSGMGIESLFERVYDRLKERGVWNYE